MNPTELSFFLEADGMAQTILDLVKKKISEQQILSAEEIDLIREFLRIIGYNSFGLKLVQKTGNVKGGTSRVDFLRSHYTSIEELLQLLEDSGYLPVSE